MQLHRLSHLVFPQPSAGPANERGMAEPDTASAQPSPGVLYTGSAVGTTPGGQQEPTDIASMSLEELITLGKSKGVFNQITYTRNGTFGQVPAQAHEAPTADFVASAVSIMRDFQEGMATLKTESSAPPTARTHLWENGFKSLRQAVERLNVMA